MPARLLRRLRILGDRVQSATLQYPSRLAARRARAAAPILLSE
jgi:hypothetical protein